MPVKVSVYLLVSLCSTVVAIIIGELPKFWNADCNHSVLAELEWNIASKVGHSE